MINRHREALASPWRLLSPARQALLVLDGTLIRTDRVAADRTTPRNTASTGRTSRSSPHLTARSWRILRRLRCSPGKAGHLVKAIAVLQNHRVTQATRG
ncbi:hypothetical protein [Actinocorallia libanotica]|uniref:hypothetical protein n=1 Tax=Actinocorallia libanotica TaxID=46162 RepID=UPI003CD07FE9